MNLLIKMYARYFLLTFLITVLFSCAKKRTDDIILAKIGDKTISKKDFLERTELTVRPNFTAQNDEQYKKTLLNNLIIEKLFAKEAGNDNALLKSESFRSHIRGIKEQAMREQLFYREAFNKVDPDTNELKRRYALSSREYALQFYSIHNDELAKKIDAEFKARPGSIDNLFNSLGGGEKIPMKQVKWKDPDPIPVHEALYTQPLLQGTIIGPIKIESDNWIVMRVVDWRTVPVIGMDAEQRWNEVREKTKMHQAQAEWTDYMANVMKGKQIEFKKQAFDKLADMFLEILRAKNPEDKKEIAAEFLTVEDKDFTLDNIEDKDAFLDQPFFTIDDQEWTVRDFRKELLTHPLVYRKYDLSKRGFRKQFRYAIGDLVRDFYLTKEAYKKSLDSHPKVVRTEQMWRDSFVAIDFRNKILKQAAQEVKADSIGRTLAMNKYFDDFISSLQHKYDNEIEIDLDGIAELKITRVNLFAVQQNVPYPVVVPSFPILTSQYQISYGRTQRKAK